MIKVVKIGGNVIDSEELMDKFCKDFASLPHPVVLVHGGGALASRMQRSLGIEPRLVEGRRVTDAETLRIAAMVYAGWCNKTLVALLQKYGCNAIGLSGCDASVVTASKRPPVNGVDYGMVGDVTPSSINTSIINTLLGQGLVPVFSAINHDGKGQLLNTNADTMASSMASALGAELVYCFEKDGVLDPEGCIIPSIDRKTFEIMKSDGSVSGGMIPKLENAFKALGDGAASVSIKSALKLLEDGGTSIRP